MKTADFIIYKRKKITLGYLSLEIHCRQERIFGKWKSSGAPAAQNFRVSELMTILF